MSSVRILANLALALLLCTACGASVNEVTDGTYRAVVPSREQLEADGGDAIPGGFVDLRMAGVDLIEITVSTDRVHVRIDGIDTSSHAIAERVVVTDSEGSGPFKAKKEVLVLGDSPLRLGELVIEAAVIWPGSFDESPVITIKPRNAEERGPGVSCDRDERCVLLSAGIDPVGRYADANDPELQENPIDTIVVTDETIEMTLDTGETFVFPSTQRETSRACGLSENPVWDVPETVGLAMSDPVLVHSVCPTNPGGGFQLVVMEHSELPVLASIHAQSDGAWCDAGRRCLLFTPQ